MDNAKTVAELRADLAVATAEHADATARVTQALARMESLESDGHCQPRSLCLQ